MNRVLLLDDDVQLVQVLKLALTRKGYQVVWAETIAQAEKLIKQHNFELAIIDRGLPDGDGLTLVEDLELTRYLTKVLVLTQASSSQDKISGLESGADDYLAKPFSHQELMLRVEKLINKQKMICRELVSYKEMTLYPRTGELILNDQQLRLRKKEAAILECLIRNQGFIVTPQMLLDQIWQDAAVLPQDKTIAVYMRRIRMALTRGNVSLQTVRNVGYRLV